MSGEWGNRVSELFSVLYWTHIIAALYNLLGVE